MMGVLDSLTGVASTLLNIFGSPVTVEVDGTKYAVNGRLQSFMVDQIDGEVVQPGDTKLMIAADDIAETPTPGDFVAVGDTVLGVVNVEHEYATENVALLMLHCRA